MAAETVANIALSFSSTIMPRPSRANEHLNRALNYAATGLVVGTAAYNAVWNEETRDRDPFLTTLLQGAALAAIAGAMKKALSFKRSYGKRIDNGKRIDAACAIDGPMIAPPCPPLPPAIPETNTDTEVVPRRDSGASVRSSDGPCALLEAILTPDRAGNLGMPHIDTIDHSIERILRCARIVPATLVSAIDRIDMDVVTLVTAMELLKFAPTINEQVAASKAAAAKNELKLTKPEEFMVLLCGVKQFRERLQVIQCLHAFAERSVSLSADIETLRMASFEVLNPNESQERFLREAYRIVSMMLMGTPAEAVRVQSPTSLVDSTNSCGKTGHSLQFALKLAAIDGSNTLQFGQNWLHVVKASGVRDASFGCELQELQKCVKAASLFAAENAELASRVLLMRACLEGLKMAAVEASQLFTGVLLCFNEVLGTPDVSKFQTDAPSPKDFFSAMNILAKTSQSQD